MSVRVGRDEAEQKFSELLAQVSKGEEIEIISDGEELARLIPPPSARNHTPIRDQLVPWGALNTSDSEDQTLQQLESALIAQQVFSTPPHFGIFPVGNYVTYVSGNKFSIGKSLEFSEDQRELDEILDNISLIQSRMKADRLEIDTSFKNIDNMLTSLEN